MEFPWSSTSSVVLLTLSWSYALCFYLWSGWSWSCCQQLCWWWSRVWSSLTGRRGTGWACNHKWHQFRWLVQMMWWSLLSSHRGCCWVYIWAWFQDGWLFSRDLETWFVWRCGQIWEKERRWSRLTVALFLHFPGCSAGQVPDLEHSAHTHLLRLSWWQQWGCRWDYPVWQLWGDCAWR